MRVAEKLAFRRWKTLLIALLLLQAGELLAAAAKIDGVRVRPSPERTRIVFDLGQPVDHAIFSLTDPHRLVIDIEAAELAVD